MTLETAVQPTNQNLEWALRYFRAGWKIFPCANKQPLFEALDPWNKSWKEAIASHQINEETVRCWWKFFPNAQIAVACGKVSGITVIDCDVLKDADHKPLLNQGEQTADLAIRWCRSITSITGSGGRHVFCKYAEGVPNSVKTAHLQIDIKNDGGYVILPPSLHTESQKNYTWDPLFPWNEDGLKHMAPFPLNLIQPQRANEQSNTVDRGDRWRKIVSGVSEGSRNASAAALVGKLLHGHLDEHLTWSLLEMWNQQNLPPLPTQELKSIFLSILKLHYAKYRQRN